MATKKKKTYHWAKQTVAPDCRIFECRDYDDIKDFKRDPTGCYVLIRIEGPRIAVAVCDKKHSILAVFRGRRAQDIYQAIFEHEKKYRLAWFKEKTHIAYLGKELKKAELAIASGRRDYLQE